MNHSTIEPINLRHLSRRLKSLRRKHKVSLNALSKLSGISRRTLARLEKGFYQAPSTRHKAPQLSPRTAMRLIRLLLSPEKIDSILTDATRLSAGYAAQLGGDPQSYALIDILPDLYPYFLFHPPKNELDKFIRKEYGPDYRSSLHQLVIRPPRNLGLRLRAFRLRHDLTLVQTAALLGLSKSELHRIERSERKPSAPTSFRILRLLTAPVSLGPAQEVSRAKSRDSRHQFLEHLRLLTAPHESGAALQPGWAGNETVCDAANDTFVDESTDPMELLRRLWLSTGLKTRDLAATLSISPPHLIRLLRGDRQPSKNLLDRISRLPR